jgi:hypothetical protein
MEYYNIAVRLFSRQSTKVSVRSNQHGTTFPTYSFKKMTWIPPWLFVNKKVWGTATFMLPLLAFTTLCRCKTETMSVNHSMVDVSTYMKNKFILDGSCQEIYLLKRKGVVH